MSILRGAAPGAVCASQAGLARVSFGFAALRRLSSAPALGLSPFSPRGPALLAGHPSPASPPALTAHTHASKRPASVACSPAVGLRRRTPLSKRGAAPAPLLRLPSPPRGLGGNLGASSGGSSSYSDDSLFGRPERSLSNRKNLARPQGSNGGGGGSESSGGNGVFLLSLLNVAVFVADHLLHLPAVKTLYLNHAHPHWWQWITHMFCHGQCW